MAKQPIDFWFFIGSMYTYLSVMRLPELAARTGATFRWRPFSVRDIMIEMDNRPLSKPLKLAYMWRDLERRAGTHGLPYPGAAALSAEEFRHRQPHRRARRRGRLVRRLYARGLYALVRRA